MKPHRVLLLVMTVGLLAVVTVRALYEAQPIPIRYAQYVIDRVEMSTIQQIAGTAATDNEIADQVITYFLTHQERLAQAFGENDPQRLPALFAMYVTHISKPYNRTEFPESLTEFLTQPSAHCGTYSFAQSQLLTAMAIENRAVNIDHDNHALIEARIGDRWEIFDATTNVWMSGSVDEVMRGLPVERRMYYTPALDPAAPPEYREQFVVVPAANTSTTLRQQQMYWGHEIILPWALF